MTFPRLLLSLLLALVLAVPTAVRADDEAATAELKELVAEQKAIFAKAEKAGDNVDLENLRSELQQLCNRYDVLLRRNPRFVPAVVAYGLLLGKIDMRKESVTLLLRANQLDKNLPVVKNQLGNYLAEEGKPVEAMNYFLSAIELAPDEPLYHFQLGTLIAEARDDFIKAGQWNREQLDKTMQEAFAKAMNLAPGDWRYAYRYGLSFYEVEKADWNAALQFWKDFEPKLKPGVEQQTCRLHQARVLGLQKRFDEARLTLASVTENVLEKQKNKAATELDDLVKSQK